MTETFQEVDPSIHIFGETTTHILGSLGVDCLLSPPDLPVEALNQYDHIISDIDGVARRYGDTVPDDIAAWYGQLRGKVSFVTLNPQLRGVMRFLDSPVYVARRAVPVIGKVGLMRQAIADSGVSTDKTISLGDGLSDVAAARLAGIRNIGLINSMGGSHPIQEKVHRAYGFVLKGADSVVKKRRKH